MSGRDAFDEFDHELSSWLRQRAPREAPDRILEGALQRTARQPQRRGWLHGLGARPPAQLALRAAALVAVVVGAAVIGLQLSNLAGPGESPSPLPSSSPSEAPTASSGPVAGCPAAPFTFVTVTGVALEDRQACFGGEEMALTGWVLRMTASLPSCEPSTPKALWWLTCEQQQQPLAFGSPEGPFQPATRLLWLATDPQGPVGPTVLGAEFGQAILTNTWVEVTGHFDDQAAGGCGYFAADPIRDACAGTFVVTSVTVLVAPWPMEALASSECTTRPLDLLSLIVQTDPATCFGSAAISVDAQVRRAGVVDGPCLLTEPAWFSCNSWLSLEYVRPTAARESIVLATARADQPQSPGLNIPSGGFTTFLFAAIHPDAGIPLDQVTDGFVRVTGHFDDPAAMTCQIPGMPQDEAIRSCRNMFVVTSVVPIE